MTSSKKLRFSGLIIGAVTSTIGLSISAQAMAADRSAGSNITFYGSLVVADAHPYQHCHNLSKRTYCHKKDRLPQNYPPNTDTPHRGESENDARRDCPPGSKRCANNTRYGKG